MLFSTPMAQIRQELDDMGWRRRALKFLHNHNNVPSGSRHMPNRQRFQVTCVWNYIISFRAKKDENTGNLVILEADRFEWDCYKGDNFNTKGACSQMVIDNCFAVPLDIISPMQLSCFILYTCRSPWSFIIPCRLLRNYLKGMVLTIVLSSVKITS